MDLFSRIVGGLARLLGGVDELITSDEERLALKAQIADTLAPLLAQASQYETTLLEAKARVIEAETNSEHILTATWRPISMLVMLAFVIVSAILQSPIPAFLETAFLVGFGGYVGGRSLEKISVRLADAIADKASD